jgi:magnesium-transporting ATPase (P-type)
MTMRDDHHLPHARPAAEVLRALAVDPVQGLSAAEAATRLAQHGPNALIEGRRRGPVRMFLDQFTDFMIVVLLAAAVISGVIGDVTDTVVILVIVVLNAVIGFVQEYRAEAAIAALRQLAAPLARVLRDGRSHSIPAQELVAGDIVLLDAGAVVPADVRLLEVAALQTQEAALTGESAAVSKSADAQIADMPPWATASPWPTRARWSCMAARAAWSLRPVWTPNSGASRSCCTAPRRARRRYRNGWRVSASCWRSWCWRCVH